MTSEPKRLDWAGARARLEQIRESLENAETLSPDHLLRIYNERAERLAGLAGTISAVPKGETLLVFRIGHGRYAFRANEVTEVAKQSKLAPVPGAPASIAGVVQVRGEIRPVYDLQNQLGIAGSANVSEGEIILMRVGDRQFGVRVDAVEEIRTMVNETQRQASDTAHVAWTTGDLVNVLNIDSLIDREP